MNLNQITVPSLNVPRAIKFYESLGLKLIVHTHDAYARFECPVGDATFSIHQATSLPSGNGITVYFEVEDLNQRYAELCEIGIHFDHPPKDQPWLWKEASLKDLDGNQLILFQAGVHRKNPPWRKDNQS